MILSDVSVKRPVFAAVISLLLLAFGWLSFMQLPVRELPDVDSPNVSISTDYPGASAAVVESRITMLIEEQISGIEGVRTISSSSVDGRSRVNIEFELSRNIDNAANDVRDRVARVVGRLPEEADAPEVSKANSDERAILWFNLTSDVLDQLQLSDYAERNIIDRLSVVDGVARVRLGGSKRYAIRIWIDPLQLAARNLTVADVESVLRSENVELPGGRVESPELDFTVRVERSYRSPEDFGGLVVGEGTDGHLIRLDEIARIELAPADERQEYRGDGESAVGLGIVKQSTANTLEVAQKTVAEVERIRTTLPPSMELKDSFDSSVFVAEAITEVYRTLFIAIALVIVVIFLFLGNLRAAIVPSLTVPVCLVATFMALEAAGYSINLLTLLALVLTIGLVVDDSIVVLENIHRRIEAGEPALLASYRGAKQVSFAVIATTLVLIGVFIPVVFLEGVEGRLLSEIALTLSAAVAFSSIVALSLSPMLCSKLLSRKAVHTKLDEQVAGFFRWLSRYYVAALKICFNNKTAIFLILIGSVLLIGGMLKIIPKEYMPNEDRGAFLMSARGVEGNSFESTRETMLDIEQRILPAIEDGRLARLIVRIPGFGGATEANTGFGILILPKWDEREASTDEMIGWVRQQVSDITDISAYVGPFRFGGGSGNPVQFVVGGNSYEELAYFRDVILEEARKNPGLVNVQADYRETKPQVKVVVDKDRAADLGVPIQVVGRTLETMLGGRRVTTYEQRGEEYDVILQAGKENRSNSEDIDKIYVRSSRTGELIPLSNLLTTELVADSGALNRYNRVRALTIDADLAPGYTLGEALQFLEDTVVDRLPEASAIDFKGESREFKESGDAIIFMFLLALAVVYLILAAQFESFIHPFTIMLTVPLAIAGGLIGLYILNDSLNIYSQVGIIILIGLASKNGILIVEFANQLRDKGLAIEQALLEACETRLRPILMTGISTAAGTLPLVLATGPGSMSRASIGIVIVTGVIFSTFFTLFVIPVFYRMLAPFTNSPGAVASKLSGQNERHPDKRPADMELPAE